MDLLETKSTLDVGAVVKTLFINATIHALVVASQMPKSENTLGSNGIPNAGNRLWDEK